MSEFHVLAEITTVYSLSVEARNPDHAVRVVECMEPRNIERAGSLHHRETSKVEALDDD